MNLELSLATPGSSEPPPPPPPRRRMPSASQSRRRRRPTNLEETIPRPFPWATDRRATVRPLDELVADGITQIHGELRCQSCDAREVVTYDLVSTFTKRVEPLYYHEIREIVSDRAPGWLLNPEYPDCRSCGRKRMMQPAVADRKREINWLFLLLDGTLGCLTMKSLSYFCRHNKYHSTGAKNRTLFYAFAGLCIQLLRDHHFHGHLQRTALSG